MFISALLAILAVFLVCILILFTKYNDLRHLLENHWSSIEEHRKKLGGLYVQINAYQVPIQDIVKTWAAQNVKSVDWEPSVASHFDVKLRD